MTESEQPQAPATAPAASGKRTLGRVIFLVITLACFAYLYYRLNGAAQREGLTLIDYMSQVFAGVNWLPWLALMSVTRCSTF